MSSLLLGFTLYIIVFVGQSSSLTDDSAPALMRRLLDDDGTGSTSSTGSNCPGDSFCAGRRSGNYANPDPYSKRYFIQCSNGYAYCTQCPDTLVFNPTSDSCERSTSGPGTRAQPLGSPDPVYNDDKGNCPDASYCSKIANRYYPAENAPGYNPSYYIQCAPGDETTGGDRLYCMPCPDGLVFVQNLNCISRDDAWYLSTPDQPKPTNDDDDGNRASGSRPAPVTPAPTTPSPTTPSPTTPAPTTPAPVTPAPTTPSRIRGCPPNSWCLNKENRIYTNPPGYIAQFYCRTRPDGSNPEVRCVWGG